MSSVEEIKSKIPLKPRHLGLVGINPLINYDSASRAVMVDGHIGQAITIDNSELRMMVNGVEREMGKFTYSVKTENDSRVIAAIPRYRGVSSPPEISLIVENLNSGKIELISIKSHSDYHKYFGFKYKWNKILSFLNKDAIIPKDTFLATSPNLKNDNRDYGIGLNLNYALVDLPEIAEDAIIISDEVAERFSYSIYDKLTVEFGDDSFALNLYGDENNYKIFPNIGEYTRDDGLVMAVREVDDMFSPILNSKKNESDFSPEFDKGFYVRGRGKVEDIKVYYSPNKKEPLKKSSKQAYEYSEMYKQYHKEMVEAHNEIVKECKQRYGREPEFSHELTVEIRDALVQTYNGKSPQIKKIFKKELLNILRIDFVIEHKAKLTIGSKLTDFNGAKSIVCEIRPKHKMPMDKNGVYADVCSDAKATISRMNIGRLHERFMNGSAVTTRNLVMSKIASLTNSDSSMESIHKLTTNGKLEVFKIIVDFVEYFANEQFTAYKKALEEKDIISITEILEETVSERLYYRYVLDNPAKAHEIIIKLRNSKFKPLIDKVIIDGKESKEDIMIAPLYTILLSKIADTWLSCSSAVINHFGVPVAMNKSMKDGVPFKWSPVKNISETEGRIYAGYSDLLADLMNRAKNIEEHKHIYTDILKAEKPTDIEDFSKLHKVEYSKDKITELYTGILNVSGIDISYIGD